MNNLFFLSKGRKMANEIITELNEKDRLVGVMRVDNIDYISLDIKENFFEINERKIFNNRFKKIENIKVMISLLI